ncbi:hypothetical protein HKD37_06G016773 [Glycine soja]
MHKVASKKLPAKRSKKDATGEGSSAAPQANVDFDRHRFQSEEHQRLFEAIKGLSFLRDRRVQLRDKEYDKFQERVKGKRSWVRGQWIPFDEDAINQFLGRPLVLEEG